MQLKISAKYHARILNHINCRDSTMRVTYMSLQLSKTVGMIGQKQSTHGKNMFEYEILAGIAYSKETPSEEQGIDVRYE